LGGVSGRAVGASLRWLVGVLLAVMSVVGLLGPLVVGSVLPLRSGRSALRLSSEAGIAPRRAPHFLCLAKEGVDKIN